MIETEEPKYRSFGLYPRHYDLLDSVNANSNIALRTILDSLIRNDKRDLLRERLNVSIIIVSFGFMFWFMGYFVNIWWVSICFFVGASLLICYGFLGGIHDYVKVQRTTKIKKQ